MTGHCGNFERLDADGADGQDGGGRRRLWLCQVGLWVCQASRRGAFPRYSRTTSRLLLGEVRKVYSNVSGRLSARLSARSFLGASLRRGSLVSRELL